VERYTFNINSDYAYKNDNEIGKERRRDCSSPIEKNNKMYKKWDRWRNTSYDMCWEAHDIYPVV
jgi:hypothetical protein